MGLAFAGGTGRKAVDMIAGTVRIDRSAPPHIVGIGITAAAESHVDGCCPGNSSPALGQSVGIGSFDPVLMNTCTCGLAGMAMGRQLIGRQRNAVGTACSADIVIAAGADDKSVLQIGRSVFTIAQLPALIGSARATGAGRIKGAVDIA